MVAILLFASTSNSLKMLITNDDSWATANIRAIYYAAKKAGHDALISAPVMQQSGVGELMREAVILEEDGEFGLIKKGAPAEGHDKNDGELSCLNSHHLDLLKERLMARSYLVRQYNSNWQCQVWLGSTVFALLWWFT